eukprot:COSAG06_NODE_57066_length_281_cov_50.868132_1_plen_30_part_01
MHWIVTLAELSVVLQSKDRSFLNVSYVCPE